MYEIAHSKIKWDGAVAERTEKNGSSVRPSWIPFGKFYGEFYININTGDS